MTPRPRGFDAVVALALGLGVVAARGGDGEGGASWSVPESVASCSWDARSGGGEGGGDVGDFFLICFLPPMIPSPFDFFDGGFCDEGDLRLIGSSS
jgi:hypothetical protein